MIVVIMMGYKGIFPGKVLCSWSCRSSLGRSHVAILNWFSGLVVVIYSGLQVACEVLAV